MIPSLSATQIQKQFHKGEISALEIVEASFQRIHAHDGSIRAFLHLLQERAEARARALDLKRASGKPLGKLAGVPIAIKDNIHIKGEKTTCGSLFLENYKAPFDATVVRLLEEEDALLVGKTNLDEFAMGSSTEHSAFFPTHNPWKQGYTPGGSSGGSAAAVAAEFCPLSFGSDTGGSIRQPAALCGIVGFKPTYGRVSRYGLVAFGSSLDQLGPFARSVEDIGLVMEVIGRHCERDSTSLFQPPEQYRSQFKKNLQGIRVGVPFSFVDQLDEGARKIFDASLDVMRSLGATVHDISLPTLPYSIAIYYILATAEASTNLARFDGIGFSRRSAKASSLSEIYEYSKQEGFGAEVKRRILLGTYVLSAGFHEAYYTQAQKVRTKVIREFASSFEKCHYIALPTTSGGAYPMGSITDPLQEYLQDLFTIGANLAGLPAISIPGGFTEDHLPLGLQLIGPQKGDVALLANAHAIEQATPQNRRTPEFY